MASSLRKPRCMVASCACRPLRPRIKASTCAAPKAAPGSTWPGLYSTCTVRGPAEWGGRGGPGSPGEVFSQGSVCRGQRAQGPGEPREDPGSRRQHRQAVLQGRGGAQRHHQLEEGRGQPPPAGEGTGWPSPAPALLPPSLSSSSLHFQEDALIRLPTTGILAGGSCQPPALLCGCPPAALIPALNWPVPLCLPSLASPCQAAFDPFSPCGRPVQSAQTSPRCSSLPSRPPMPASTSVWPPAPRAPPRPGFKWWSFQVRGPQGLEE